MLLNGQGCFHVMVLFFFLSKRYSATIHARSWVKMPRLSQNTKNEAKGLVYSMHGPYNTLIHIYSKGILLHIPHKKVCTNLNKFSGAGSMSIIIILIAFLSLNSSFLPYCSRFCNIEEFRFTIGRKSTSALEHL